MTLKDYYKNLPERTSPKFDFLKKVSELCNVTVTTARNWCIYGMKPKTYTHVKILSEISGIKEEDLWSE